MIKKILCIIIAVLLITLAGDYILTMRLNKDPWFIIKTEDNIKYGLFYKIDYNEGTEFYIFDFKVDEIKSEPKEIEIIEEPYEFCIQEIVYFYEDDENEYYFSCPRDVYVKVDNVEYTIQNALENKLVTIDELKELGLEFGVSKKKN